ncbi:MAG TPA: hypothetical protein VGD02_03790 [Gemmatimonadaceae bacterium]|jgi:hypothetical protein
MEQNDRESLNPNGGEQTSFGNDLNSNFGGTTGGFSNTGAGGSDASSFQNSGSSGSSGGSAGSSRFSTDQKDGSGSGMTDRVKSVASSVKGKASNIPGMLADGLQAGAQALRQRRTAIAGGDGSTASVGADGSQIVAITDSLADGMQSSAEWLRDADLDKIKDGLETQVKEHPARTLLIALGAGYVIGKAFRR